MTVSQLDPREEHFRIPSHHHGRSLFLRYLPPSAPPFDKGDRTRATHLMHLETNRYALYRETEAFLLARDVAPTGQMSNRELLRNRPKRSRRTCVVQHK
jgi:hypothetical protein